MLLYGLVLILDGKSVIGARVKSEINNLTCLRYLFRSTADRNLKKNQKCPVALHTCAMLSEVNAIQLPSSQKHPPSPIKSRVELYIR